MVLVMMCLRVNHEKWPVPLLLAPLDLAKVVDDIFKLQFAIVSLYYRTIGQPGYPKPAINDNWSCWLTFWSLKGGPPIWEEGAHKMGGRPFLSVWV